MACFGYSTKIKWFYDSFNDTFGVVSDTKVEDETEILTVQIIKKILQVEFCV